MIDITTTATIRPELIDSTFKSFTENMFTKSSNVRLIINIDPIGDDNCTSDDVLNVCKKYFSNIIVNTPETPSFARAVIWCWSNTISETVFHLEEDWKLLNHVNIGNLISIINSCRNLVSLRLSKEVLENIPYVVREKEYMIVPRLSLNPTLFKGSFVRDISKLMTTEKNPEKQLRDSDKTERGLYLKNVKHSVYIPKKGSNCIVEDIGRDWMKNSKFEKDCGFTAWKLKNKSV